MYESMNEWERERREKEREGEREREKERETESARERDIKGCLLKVWWISSVWGSGGGGFQAFGGVTWVLLPPYHSHTEEPGYHVTTKMSVGNS